MKKEIISKKQAISIFILFTFGTNALLGTGLAAGKDAYIAIILSMIVALPLIIIYYKICEMFPDRDLFQIINLVFGKFLGKIVVILYILFTYHLAAILLIVTTNFIDSMVLFYTPKAVISFTFCFIIAWGLKEGIETIARCSEFFIILVISFVLLISLLALNIIDFQNLRPVLYGNINKIPKAILITVSFPFSQYFLFLILNNNFDKKENIKKIFLQTLLIAGAILSFGMFIIAGVIPEYKITSLYYVTFETIRLIKITDFVERIEIIIIFTYLFSVFVKISVCLLGTLKGLQNIFQLSDYRYLVVPVVALTFNLSLILYKSTMETSEFASEIYPYYSIPFQIIIPIILFIVAKIKYKNKPLK